MSNLFAKAAIFDAPQVRAPRTERFIREELPKCTSPMDALTKALEFSRVLETEGEQAMKNADALRSLLDESRERIQKINQKLVDQILKDAEQ